MSFSLIVKFFYGVGRFETMTDLFSVSIRFNGGNPQMFKVRYINVTLKGLKYQLNEINQGLNPEDTRRVKYIWYERPTLDDGRITFSRLELKNDDDVRSMFSIFWQHSMVPFIDMFVMLQRSIEDILNSLIPPEDRD
jgi:hypothetical protein